MERTWYVKTSPWSTQIGHVLNKVQRPLPVFVFGFNIIVIDLLEDEIDKVGQMISDNENYITLVNVLNQCIA